MKQKIDIFEMSRRLNTFRETAKKLNKSYSGAELNEALTKLGFSKVMASAIAQACFPYEQMGKSRLYDIPNDPIHKDVLRKLYDKQNNYNKRKSVGTTVKTPIVDKFSEAKEVQDAIQLLLSKGYKISRPLGLDVKQLLADHPELAKQYMRYDTI